MEYFVGVCVCVMVLWASGIGLYVSVFCKKTNRIIVLAQGHVQDF